MRRVRPHSLLVLNILLLPVSVLLANCGKSDVRIGWSGTNVPGHIAYRYATFTGSESGSARVETGQSIVLDYQVTASKGSLSITVRGPDERVVWQVALQGNSSDNIELPMALGGRYEMIIEGKAAGGSFDITWDVK
jgi:hypothetical protein